MPDLIEASHRKADRFFGDGVDQNLLQGRYDTAPVHAWFQKRHQHFGHHLVDPTTHIATINDHTWRVPYGVRYALANPLRWSQIASKYPWYVTWQSPTTHRRVRKRFETLASAIVFVTTKAQYADSDACIVSRQGYDIPPPLRGKLPNPKLGYWCPCCMTNRRFYPTVPMQVFYAQKKVYSAEKQRYVPTARKLRLLRCRYCGITNRDPKFRRSNQPWERRRIKSGVRRVKRVRAHSR